MYYRNETDFKEYKECEGCRTANKCVAKPYYFNEQGNKIECPCQICLVKGVCHDSCYDFFEYASGYFKSIGEGYNTYFVYKYDKKTNKKFYTDWRSIKSME